MPNKPNKQNQKKNNLKQRAKNAAVKALKAGGKIIQYSINPMSALSDAAGYVFNKITGSGDYQVRGNTLIGDSGPPSFASNKRSIRVRHREYIKDISGSTEFKIAGFPINPGLSDTFPWLSSVAQSFEQYKIHGMVFEFKSTSATALNSTNTALGTVIMATEYDVLKPPFVNKQQMENYFFCTNSKPSDSFLHPIECAQMEQPTNVLYVRDNDQSTGQSYDLRFSDHGQMYLATVGMQAAAVIGELWVSYDIELFKPRIDPYQEGDSVTYFMVSNIASPMTITNQFPNKYLSPFNETKYLRGFETSNTQITWDNAPWLVGRTFVLTYMFNEIQDQLVWSRYMIPITRIGWKKNHIYPLSTDATYAGSWNYNGGSYFQPVDRKATVASGSVDTDYQIGYVMSFQITSPSGAIGMTTSTSGVGSIAMIGGGYFNIALTEEKNIQDS